MNGASSMAFSARQTAMRGWIDALERWLDTERDQLVLWLPVILGAGIAAWFILPDEQGWIAVIAGGAAIAIGGLAVRSERRTSRVLIAAGLCVALGCALMWEIGRAHV